jgi:hypothetical protein
MIQPVTRTAGFVLLFTSALTLSGCAPTPVKTAPAPKATFSYQGTEACAKPGASGVAFAVVAPQWTKSEGARLSQVTSTQLGRMVYTEMPGAMRDDFFALLGCRGFATKGPYTSGDEMVYPDRVGTDLILSPEIEISLVFAKPAVVSRSKGLFSVIDVVAAASGDKSMPAAWGYKGQLEVRGRVVLALRESLTDTRMWTKAIPLDPVTVDYVGERTFGPNDDPNASVGSLYNDAGVLRAIAPKLEGYYQTTLGRAATYFDVQEMQMVRNQSQDIRKRANATIKGQ